MLWLPLRKAAPTLLRANLTTHSLYCRLSIQAGGFLCSIATALLLICSFSTSAYANSTLKLTTWNMDWLTLRPVDDPALPPDIPSRTEADFDQLRHYAEKLHSDLIAFQEVDGLEAIDKIFPSSSYQIFITPDPIIQRVGLAIRRNSYITAHENTELTSLNVVQPGAHHPLRGGLDITIQKSAAQLRLLIVHLKTGCWAQPLITKKRACSLLFQQFHIIDEWILDRIDDHIPFAILGDFNRRLTPHDPLMKEWASDAPLTLTTEGHSSPCGSGEQFIDHIILGNAARQWLVPDSLRVMTFRHAVPSQHLSDHCPVSIQLTLP